MPSQTHRRLHRHTDAFTHRGFFTHPLLHIDVFTHTDAFTHRRFSTQAPVRTDAFTQRRFHTQTLLHRRFFTQQLLRTDAFTPGRFYKQTLFHRRLYTQTLWHKNACRKCFSVLLRTAKLAQAARGGERATSTTSYYKAWTERFPVLLRQRKFRSQTSDNMNGWRKSQRGEEPKREDQRRERVRRKKMQVREKVGTLCVFPMICGSEGSKSRLAKAAMRDEKFHAVVAQSTFPSQNVQDTPTSDHFWKLRCRKSARRCGAKHIPKSTCRKHVSLGALLEVEMSKNCTPLWREARSEVKM